MLLYKEDFEKFLEGLNESVEFIQTNQAEAEIESDQNEDQATEEFTAVEFDDLKEDN